MPSLRHLPRLASTRLFDALRGAPAAVRAAVVVLAFAAWVAAASSAWFARGLSTGLPDRDELRRIGEMAQATTILDAAGAPAFTIFREQRIEVPIARMSPHLVEAIIAIEDQRFFEHHGVDGVRVLGAVAANLREGRRAQGGSTITQQLARQSFLTPDKTWRRKLQEVMLAQRLERNYTKHEILELYLNKVYFGDGLYGVEAASLGFFGRHASELDLPQAALLAGLVKSPSSYAPTVSLERAVSRRNVVLQAMAESGSIDAAAARAAKQVKVDLVDGLHREEPRGQYFKEQVRQALVEKFGWQRVYQGGLRVRTSYDPALQEAAEKRVAEQLEAIEAQRAKRAKARAGARKTSTEPEPPADPPLQAALVALDPKTGAVRALVGGRDFDESRFNRAAQARRQPGSAFKPFVFAAAIEQGFTPASIIDHLGDPVMTVQGAWTPEDEHATSDSMTLRTALRTSSNRAAVRLLQQVGIERAVKYARDLGVGSVPSVPSLALGSGEVTLLAMTAAYASFANGGLLPSPTLIHRVETADGEVLLDAAPAPRRVLSETTAFLVTSMLADVVNYGTAYRARSLGFTLPAAGKTGTTNDFVDAWFVGFTPSLVTGVWIGFDQPRTILPNGFAGDLAVPLWAKFMKDATKGSKAAWYATPKGIGSAQVCRLSGLLPNHGCDDVEVIDDEGNVEHRSMVYTEFFLRGQQPTEECPLHPGESLIGKFAGVFGKDGPAPTPATAVGLPPASAPGEPEVEATTGTEPAAPAQAETPKKKKRGFWARVFGVGKDEDEKPREQEPKPQN
jgi:penicillin-binding protein 1A